MTKLSLSLLNQMNSRWIVYHKFKVIRGYFFFFYNFSLMIDINDFSRYLGSLYLFSVLGFLCIQLYIIPNFYLER